MGQLVILSLGSGSCHTGFQTVTAQLWEEQTAVPSKWSAGLPACPELAQLYERWHLLYEALYARLHWRRLMEQPGQPGPARGQTAAENPNAGVNLEDVIEFEAGSPNHVSEAEFYRICHQLEACLNQWLQSSEFLKLDQRLRMRLDTSQQIQVIIETDDVLLRHLPWHLWNLLELCPQSNVAMSAQEYDHSENIEIKPVKAQIRILAVLGHSDGIDIQQDRQMLEQLPCAEVVFLTEPQRQELDQWLWHPEGWDILFFAGHSSSQQSQGKIYLNPTESLTLKQLHNALRAAIQRGLQLAIFNSCDGLGLARTLGDLNIPQLIVMREPVPDQVAQAFLKHFLQLFSRGESFFAAVGQARERLQGLEGEFPCASWLPTICQNPTAPSLSWPISSQAKAIRASSSLTVLEVLSGSESIESAAGQQLLTSTKTDKFFLRRAWHSFGLSLVTAISVASLVMGLRAVGGLRSLELWAYDHLILLQPDEDPDDRLLLVEVTEEDLRQYGWPISDKVLTQLLTKLNAAKPRVIGVDIFRDLPQEPGHSELQQFWQQSDNTIAICLHSDVNNLGISPPPSLSADQVGFNDVPLDANDRVRRQLWAMEPTTRSECTTQLSFSFLLALQYLEAEGIEGERHADGSIQLGDVRIEQLPSLAGGYQDLAGYQTMLRYRRHKGSAEDIIQRVCLEDLLEGRVSEALIRDRLVLIGLTANSIQDSFVTPYGNKLRGVMLHAQMVSQILSVVLEGRSLITVWPFVGELLWVGSWSMVGGLLAGRGRSQRHYQFLNLVGVLVVIVSSAGCLWLGVWVPLVPGGSSLLLSSLGVRFFNRTA